MTPADQMRALDARIVRESRDAVRWAAMRREVAVRLPELCRDAEQAALRGRLRVRLLRQGAMA